MITKEWTEALASHSHVNQGHWGKNIQTKNSNNSIPPPANKNICYAGLSVITEGRMSSWKSVGPYQFSWTRTMPSSLPQKLFSSGCIHGRLLQRIQEKKIKKKKAYPPPLQETGKCSFSLQSNRVPTPDFFPRRSHCLALNLLRQ